MIKSLVTGLDIRQWQPATTFDWVSCNVEI